MKKGTTDLGKSDVAVKAGIPILLDPVVRIVNRVVVIDWVRGRGCKTAVAAGNAKVLFCTRISHPSSWSIAFSKMTDLQKHSVIYRKLPSEISPLHFE
jgi:hypothetical protein